MSLGLCFIYGGLFGNMTVYPQKEGNNDNFDVLGWWKSFAANNGSALLSLKTQIYELLESSAPVRLILIFAMKNMGPAKMQITKHFINCLNLEVLFTLSFVLGTIKPSFLSTGVQPLRLEIFGAMVNYVFYLINADGVF
ncbi:hypothetical protein ACJX0J_035394 [Zea mays]